MKQKVVRIIGLVDGSETRFDGEYVVEYRTDGGTSVARAVEMPQKQSSGH